jgi:hypothetical protein
MNNKWIRFVALMALTGVSAMAQQQSSGGNYNPVNTMWWIFFMIYSIYAAVIGIAILWHCGHGALGSHDGMSKIVVTILFGAIGFGVVYIIQTMVAGAAAPTRI